MCKQSSAKKHKALVNAYKTDLLKSIFLHIKKRKCILRGYESNTFRIQYSVPNYTFPNKRELDTWCLPGFGLSTSPKKTCSLATFACNMYSNLNF